MRGALARFDRLLHPVTSPVDLACVRIATCAWLLVSMATFEATEYATLPDALWEPVSYFRLLDLPRVGPSTMTVLHGALCVALGLGALGVATRASVGGATLLAFYVLGYQNCLGKIHHAYHLPMMLLVVLAFSRCGDALSLDALRRGGPRPEASGTYGWPVVLGRTTLVLLMFAAGVSKLLGTWWPPDPARFEALLTRGHVLASLWGVEPPRLTIELARHPGVAAVLGYAALLLELAAPLALFRGGVVRLVVIGGLLGMQVFNAAALHIHAGLPWLAGYLFFVPWSRLPGPARQR